MEPQKFKKLLKVSKPNKIGDDKLMSVAYHETGHVLISLIYGLPGTTTTIIPDLASNRLFSCMRNTWRMN